MMTERQDREVNQSKDFHCDDSYYGKYAFMFRKIAISGTLMAWWLKVPEFIAKLDEMDSAHITIDNDSVLSVMQEICSNKKSLRDSGKKVDFRFKNARQSISQLQRRLGGKVQDT